MCNRNRAIRFPFDDINCHEKSFKEVKPRVINYRSHKSFSNEVFRESLLEKLSQQSLSITNMGLECFAILLLKH